MPAYNGLHVPAQVEHDTDAFVAEYLRTHDRFFPPTHEHAGHDSERAGVGLPGHCGYCAIVGHVVAHPDFGCTDVRCTVDH